MVCLDYARKMAEYIDKNATVGILEAMSRNTDCECIKKRLEKAAKRVSTIPAANVAPVVHGRWVSVAGKRDRICSRCLRNEPYKNADDDAEVFEFCPHCGAKMDGGADNG